MGYLYLIKIGYKIIKKTQMEFAKIKLINNIKVHNSLIKGLLFDKRLNIIISYSEDGQISINNGFDLNLINKIKNWRNLLKKGKLNYLYKRTNFLKIYK